jgi:RHS repeat-associated protein
MGCPKLTYLHNTYLSIIKGSATLTQKKSVSNPRSNYIYGFQGQEKDDEVKGEGNSVNYKYRMHDPRVGRFFAIDPLAPKYPHNSPYAFSENTVIDHVELEGLEKADIKGNADYSATGGLHPAEYAKQQKQQPPSSVLPLGSNPVTPLPLVTIPVPTPSSSSLTDAGGPLLDGATTLAKKTDEVWIKNKNGQWFQGPQVSSSKLLKGTFGSASKSIAKRVPIVGYALDGMEIAEGIKKDGGFGDNAKIETAGAAGGTLGGMGGLWGGAATGAAIGSVVPVIGNVVGGILGGVVGAIVFSWVGEQGAEAVTKKIIEDD